MRYSSPLALILVLLVIGLTGLLALASAHPGSTDDAIILLVQSRSLLGGSGWEVQTGQGPVESVTSLLDLGLKAVVLALASENGVTTLWRTTGVPYLAVRIGCVLAPWRGRGWPVACGALALALEQNVGAIHLDRKSVG